MADVVSKYVPLMRRESRSFGGDLGTSVKLLGSTVFRDANRVPKNVWPCGTDQRPIAPIKMGG